MCLLKRLKNESKLETSTIFEKTSSPEILEIKIDMAMPYATEWSDPKDGQGILQRDGSFYTLISKDFRNDTLYFVYLKNNSAREIFSTLADQVEHQNSSPDNSNETGGIAKLFLTKYKNAETTELVSPAGLFIRHDQARFCYSFRYSSIVPSVSSPPPKLRS